MGELTLHFLAHSGPLGHFAAIWDAPALKEYSPGLRHLLLRLLTEENRRYPQGELQRRLSRLGWEWYWEASRDTLSLRAAGLVENLSTALSLFYTAIAEPLLRGPLTRLHLKRLIEGQRQAQAHPPYRADAFLADALWGQAYSLLEKASPDELEALDDMALEAYFQRFLWRGLRHILVAAPKVPSTLQAWAEWAKPLSYALPVTLPSESCVTEPFPSAKQVSLRLAYPWVRPTHSAYGFYSLAAMRLGGYFGSQLMRHIREKAGLTYGIYARAAATQVGGYLIIGTEVAQNRAAEAVERIHQEVHAWDQHPFPEEATFQEVQNSLLLQLYPEGLSAWVERLVQELARRISPSLYKERVRQIAQATWDTFPPLPLPTTPCVQVAVGASEPIFVGACA